MFKALAQALGRWWLAGPKYAVSRFLAGRDWTLRVDDALALHGRTLAHCRTLEDVLGVFDGHEFWVSDKLWGAWDTVSPPLILLNQGADDCDGNAMLHAQAINVALGPLDWKAVILTYLADPWAESHHFAAATDPGGQVWAVQPQTTAAQWAEYGHRMRLVFGPFKTYADAVQAIAACYPDVTAVCFDVRNDMFGALVPMADLPA